MGAPSEEVVYSLAITITLCTPAPLCPPRHPGPPFAVPPVSSLSSSPLSLSFSLSLFSSLLRHVVSSPLPLRHVPRSSGRIDHGYSAIVFDLSCSYCSCRSQENFTCLSLLHTLLEFFSFVLSHSLVCFLYCSSLSSSYCCLASISRAVAPFSALSRFLLHSALSFILEMGIGIHEMKLMITTSKQRAERPTATCRAVYKSHILLLHPSFISHQFDLFANIFLFLLLFFGYISPLFLRNLLFTF